MRLFIIAILMGGGIISYALQQPENKVTTETVEETIEETSTKRAEEKIQEKDFLSIPFFGKANRGKNPHPYFKDMIKKINKEGVYMSAKSLCITDVNSLLVRLAWFNKETATCSVFLKSCVLISSNQEVYTLKWKNFDHINLNTSSVESIRDNEQVVPIRVSRRSNILSVPPDEVECTHNEEIVDNSFSMLKGQLKSHYRAEIQKERREEEIEKTREENMLSQMLIDAPICVQVIDTIRQNNCRTDGDSDEAQAREVEQQNLISRELLKYSEANCSRFFPVTNYYTCLGGTDWLAGTLTPRYYPCASSHSHTRQNGESCFRTKVVHGIGFQCTSNETPWDRVGSMRGTDAFNSVQEALRRFHNQQPTCQGDVEGWLLRNPTYVGFKAESFGSTCKNRERLNRHEECGESNLVPTFAPSNRGIFYSNF